jgi:hypothetical protein
MPDTTATFAAVAVTLYAGHQLADHVLGQTDRQARDKTLPGWPGWRACLEHVALYHLVLTVMLGTVWMVLDLPLTPLGMLAGLWVSGITHAILDRRWPVRAILRATGSAPFAELRSFGMNGLYLADQACHYAALWVAALIMVGVGS